MPANFHLIIEIRSASRGVAFSRQMSSLPLYSPKPERGPPPDVNNSQFFSSGVGRDPTNAPLPYFQPIIGPSLASRGVPLRVFPLFSLVFV